MKWAFLDESGDLGKKGSRYLVMTMVVTEDIELLDNLIKSLVLTLSKHKVGKNYLKKTSNEIKYSYFPDKKLLNGFFETIVASNTKIYSVYIDKNKINRNIRMNEKELIFKHLMQHVVFKKYKLECSDLKSGLNDCIDKVFDFIKSNGLTKVTADLSFLKKAPKKSKQYCITKSFEKHKKYGIIPDIAFEEFNEKIDKKCDLVIKIDLKDSRLNTKLQIADLVSGALYDYLENGNKKNHHIIKNKLSFFDDISKEIQ